MITWRDKMSIDDGGLIDQDHRHLVEIINHFETIAADGLDRDEATEILYTLKFYTQTHFGREEKLQTLIGFPYADAHVKEHKELIETLEGAISNLKKSKVEVQKSVHKEIADMLKDWLVNHIISSDLKMRSYVDAMNKYAPGFGPLKDVDSVE
jgi:hemerythrin